MIYIFENGDRIVYDESILSKEEKLQGFGVKELPEVENRDGHIARLRADMNSKKVWYEYIEVIKTPTIEDLETQVELLSDALNEAMELLVGGVE